MKKPTVIKGKYYYEENSNGEIYISLANSELKTHNFIQIYPRKKYFGRENQSGIYGSKKLRLATPFEKSWLDECIKIGDFIEKEEMEIIINKEIHYEIY